MSAADLARPAAQAGVSMSPKPSPAAAVEAVGLVKRFGATTALTGLDLTVSSGSTFALLGRNGTGKTTTVRILAALLRPDAGTARVLGHDLARDAEAVRARISLTGQLASVDDDLTGRENLVLLGRLLGLSRRDSKHRAAQLLEAFGLAQAAGRLVKTYSGGMRRRLDIAASLVVRPDLLFLDEPTTGLDPHSRNQVWELVRALVSGGTTVLLTTQYLEEADQLADRIAVIDQGTVIAEGTSGELKASIGRGVLHVRLQDPRRRPEAEQLLTRALQGPLQQQTDPSGLSASAEPERAAKALAELTQTGIAVSDFALGQPSLEEVFLALTGRSGTETTIGKEAI